MKILFLPYLESFMCKRKFEKRNLKKYPIQPPNGVLPIGKLPFPNGSYRNGVCKALWAKFYKLLASKCGLFVNSQLLDT